MATKTGFFKPKNYSKYKGDPTKIIYRSSWEKLFMGYLDENPNVVEWSSEEFFIPYKNPVDGKIRRYFPDFYTKGKQADGGIKKMIIEVKPKVQCKPPKEPKRRTKRWMNEVVTYSINDAKWRYATEWCADNGMEFKILTEDHLGISYK